MDWSYLVNLVNVSSLYWQATFARRCLLLLYANDQTVVWMLRLTWFQQCACFGVEVHSLNMSSVMSRVSNGVGHWVSLAIDLSWRRTQGHHGESRHQAVDACASDLHSGTARRRRGSGSEVCLCEMESERVVCVRAMGPREFTCDFRLSSCSASPCGLVAFASSVAYVEAMVGHVTPVNWPVPMNCGPQWSPKKKGLGRARHEGVIWS